MFQARGEPTKLWMEQVAQALSLELHFQDSNAESPEQLCLIPKLTLLWAGG